ARPSPSERRRCNVRRPVQRGDALARVHARRAHLLRARDRPAAQARSARPLSRPALRHRRRFPHLSRSFAPPRRRPHPATGLEAKSHRGGAENAEIRGVFFLKKPPRPPRLRGALEAFTLASVRRRAKPSICPRARPL